MTNQKLAQLFAWSRAITASFVPRFIGVSILLFLTQTLFSQTYCTAKSNAPWQQWIARVQFANLDNLSGKARENRYVVGYSDYTDVLANVFRGQTHPLSTTPQTSGTAPILYWRIWIDYNRNGVFDATEQVAQFTDRANPADRRANITIPTTASLGVTRMRVAMKVGSFPTSCETFAQGEVEDYSIWINAANTCPTDNVPPVIRNCPANIAQTPTSITCMGVRWTPPTATDNCSATTLLFASKSNTPLSSGSTPTDAHYTTCTNIDSIFYTAIDARGNRSVCAFQIRNGCYDIKRAGGELPRNVVLTTTGSCALFRWNIPYDFRPCQQGGTYVGWQVVTPSPVVVNRVSENSATRTFQDAACFPIGKTKIYYTGVPGALDSLIVTVNFCPNSTGGCNATNVDIGLGIAATPSVYRPFSNTTFRISARNNHPTTAASNVLISFHFPNQTVTGGTAVPSVGTWREWCSGTRCFTWTIPNLAANTTATLDLL